MNILVFDSGIGGLTVLEKIQQRLPQANYYYLFDNARLPYGELAEQALVSGALKLILAMIAKHQPDIIVIACNTASTILLPQLRSRTSIPIVGVVPAIKPAAQTSSSKRIGLLATPATVSRSYTRDLIKRFAGHCYVGLYGSSELVEMAEAKMAGRAIDIEQLDAVIKPIIADDIDTLVLGCTHFPLLATELNTLLDSKVMLLDSSDAIAARVVDLCDEAMDMQLQGSKQAYFTTEGIEPGLMKTLTKWGFSQVLPHQS